MKARTIKALRALPQGTRELSLPQIHGAKWGERRSKALSFNAGFSLTVAVVGLWYYAYAMLLAPQAVVASAPLPIATLASQPFPPADLRAAWAFDLAVALGNPQPSGEMVAAVVAWTLAEDSCMTDCGYASAYERNNLLNTTQTGFNETAVFNSHGVRAYATREDGIAATVQTLSYGYAGYEDIREAIRTNDVPRLFAGIHASPWCSACYGGNIEALYARVRGE